MDLVIAYNVGGIVFGGIQTIFANLNKIFSFQSQSVNATEMQSWIREMDIQTKIKIIELALKDLQKNKNKNEDEPESIAFCIASIEEAVCDINAELTKIYARMSYNSRIWFGSSLRAYKFHNCKKRLQTKIQILQNRFQHLKTLHAFFT
jgi:hypothetical protein